MYGREQSCPSFARYVPSNKILHSRFNFLLSSSSWRSICWLRSRSLFSSVDKHTPMVWCWRWVRLSRQVAVGERKRLCWIRWWWRRCKIVESGPPRNIYCVPKKKFYVQLRTLWCRLTEINCSSNSTNSLCDWGMERERGGGKDWSWNKKEYVFFLYFKGDVMPKKKTLCSCEIKGLLETIWWNEQVLHSRVVSRHSTS